MQLQDSELLNNVPIETLELAYKYYLKLKANQRKWKKTHREKWNEYQREYKRKQRNDSELLKHLIKTNKIIL